MPKHLHRVGSCLSVSDVLKSIPVVSADYVFIAREHQQGAEGWLAEKRREVIAPQEGAEI
jgi:hypothetical protein